MLEFSFKKISTETPLEVLENLTAGS